MDQTTRLAHIGALIYGGQWAAPMARDLGISVRAVDRWRAGTAPVPVGIWSDLDRIARALAGAVPPSARQRAADLIAAAEAASAG